MFDRLQRLIVLFAITLFAAAPVAAQDTATAQDDADALRELLVRILMPIYTGSLTELDDDAIAVGELPANLPFDIPMPEGTHIVGGLIGLGNNGTGQVYLTLPGSAEDARSFYTDAFGDAWHPAPQPSMSGFTGAAWEPLVFCSADNTRVMSVLLADEMADETPVNIQWQEAYAGACEGQPGMSGGLSPVMPTLRQPAGAQMHGGSSGGGGNNNSFMSATLSTDLSAEALVTHYGDQLNAAGWQQTNASTTDASAFSTWTMQDEDGDNWVGILIVVDSGDDDRTAFFQVSQVE